MKPYDALAEVYDRWTATNDYPRWAQYLHSRFDNVHEILDVCCGTGTMTRLMQSFGYSVSGVDGSLAMLAEAKRTLPDGTRLTHQVLPHAQSTPDKVDAAICCYDSVNYFTADELPVLFRYVAGCLRPRGLFAFDVNTPAKLRGLLGNSHWGDDLDDFAYVWRNRLDEQARTVRFLITLFTRTGEVFDRYEEEHVQHWFTDAEITEAGSAAGFEVVSVTDDYTDTAPSEATLRQSWLMRLSVRRRSHRHGPAR